MILLTSIGSQTPSPVSALLCPEASVQLVAALPTVGWGRGRHAGPSEGERKALSLPEAWGGGALHSRPVALSALQVSVDRLHALNATSEELRQGQHTLEGAVRELREQLLGLLQEPACRGCEQALSQTRALQLGADFSQVQAQRPLECVWGRRGCP